MFFHGRIQHSQQALHGAAGEPYGLRAAVVSENRTTAIVRAPFSIVSVQRNRLPWRQPWRVRKLL
jgi:hypothetical protein